MSQRELTTKDYERLLEFRDGLRRFMHWSERQARDVGLTPAQHQLLLAIRGHDAAPSVGEVAEHLMLRHHSAVELVDRAEAAGLVLREPDEDDHRVIRLHLSERGQGLLAELSSLHMEELSRLRGSLENLWQGLA
ncbi:MAG: MarR family transcriptional regulator [Acidimicrobiia bacterium]